MSWFDPIRTMVRIRTSIPTILYCTWCILKLHHGVDVSHNSYIMVYFLMCHRASEQGNESEYLTSSRHLQSSFMHQSTRELCVVNFFFHNINKPHFCCGHECRNAAFMSKHPSDPTMQPPLYHRGEQKHKWHCTEMCNGMPRIRGRPRHPKCQGQRHSVEKVTLPASGTIRTGATPIRSQQLTAVNLPNVTPRARFWTHSVTEDTDSEWCTEIGSYLHLQLINYGTQGWRLCDADSLILGHWG